jgi:dienelactone hydrolase
MSVGHTRGTGYSATAPSEGQLMVKHKRTPLDGTAPAILCCHSHNATLDQYTPGVPTDIDPGWHAWMLAQAGYLVFAFELAGQTAWSDQAAMDRLLDGYNHATARGARPGKVGVMAWSMGGLTALNWIKRNTAKVACAWLWAPVTDLDWARTQGTWGTEITTDYPAGSAGFNVHDEPQSWRGIGVPITVAHAGDDTTVPSSQTDAFVGAVGDPLVVKRTVSSGGHVDLFSHVPESETVQFYQAHL